MDQSCSDRMNVLVARAASQCTSDHPCGSFSASIYDTAWLSMVDKPVGSGVWLFPECFDFILKAQQSSGAWESYATTTDGILNTAASLLAMKRHLQFSSDKETLSKRIQQAIKALETLLHGWDVLSSDQVGFEMLVVQHLCLLQREHIEVEFLAFDQLQRMYDAKMAKLPIQRIDESPSTLYHSLEALIGHVDFDRLRRWRQPNGSMLGSPSSTAAYLMNVSTWDDRAEEYLMAVVRYGSSTKDGGVPSAWPTTIFDVTWMVTTLSVTEHVWKQELQASVVQFLEKSMEQGNGTVGFAPTTLPDADDTAKTIMTLRIMGRKPDIQPLLATFEAPTHVKTYQGERNPSYTTNCNVLTALLMQDDPRPYASVIRKIVKFLCSQATSGKVKDKWNTHQLYWMMLLLQAFERLEKQAQDRTLYELIFNGDDCSLKKQLDLVCHEVLLSILQTQGKDGSWGSIGEATAYAVLALTSSSSLNPAKECGPLREALCASLRRGKNYLDTHRAGWCQGRPIWIEKVTYSSNLLSETYCLAASTVPLATCDESLPALKRPPEFKLVEQRMRKAGRMLAHAPVLADLAPDALAVAELQAIDALSRLEDDCSNIFQDVANLSGGDKYMIFIPLIWTACAARLQSPIEFSVLRQMMRLSLLLFRIDEFMEAVIGVHLRAEISQVRALIVRIINSSIAPTNGQDRNVHGGQVQTQHGQGAALNDVESTLKRFIDWILHDKKVISASRQLQDRLAKELDTFLQAHITQIEDSQPGGGRKAERAPSGRSFYQWVRSTSADHTSCPVAFVYYNCLIGSNVLDGSSATAYVAEDLCRHLATMCRMYNDCASIPRDKREGNLNSVDFPEFDSHGEDEKREALMWLAEYERRGLNVAFMELEKVVGDETLSQALKLFVDVTDLFGQLYTMRDLSNLVGST